MRVPSFDRFQKFMQVTAFFVCGMIVGSAVYSGLENDRLNAAILKNIDLQQQLLTLQDDLSQAKRFQDKHTVIKSILPIVEEPHGTAAIDALTEKELKKRLKEDLSIFLGRSIYKIGSEALLARRLLEDKLYDNIGDKDYMVNVKTMLLVEGELKVWVEVKVHLRH